MKQIIIMLFSTLILAPGAARAEGHVDCAFQVLIEYRFKTQVDPEDSRRLIMMLSSSRIKADWDFNFFLDKIALPDLRVQEGVDSTVDDKSLALILRPDAKTGEKRLLAIVDPFGQHNMWYLTPIYDWDAEKLDLKALFIQDYEIGEVAGWFTADLIANISLGQVSTTLKKMFGEEKYARGKWRAYYSPETGGQYSCSKMDDEVVCQYKSQVLADVYSSIADEDYFKGIIKPEPVEAAQFRKNIQNLVKSR